MHSPSEKKYSVIVSSARTPFGCFQGKLASFSAPQLGAFVLQELVSKISLSSAEIDEVLMGCVLSGGVGQAPARQATKAAAFPNEVGAVTVSKVCGSSLKCVVFADQMIRCGDAQVVIAGGMESMSQAPYLLPRVRQGLRLGHGKVLDSMIWDGLWDPYNDFHMGNAGERCAQNFNISRKDQDSYAVRSYQRALASLEQGKFQREIVSIEIHNRKGDLLETVTEDEEIKKGGARLSKIESLRAAFAKEGTVTAANSSKISDGAAGVTLMNAEKAKNLGLKPGFRVVGYAQAALAPEDFPIAPVKAIRNLVQKTGISLEAIDRFEINEAFAVVAEVTIRQLELNPEKVNARGGAIALGHPIGASGVRILVTLMHQLEDDHLNRGVAAICLGGGEAVALMIERI